VTYQDIFKTEYQNKIGIPFIQWSGKEGKSLKELLSLIKVFWQEFKEIELTEEQQLRGFQDFLIGIQDEFVLGSFTPSVILSCFNSLAQQQYSKVKKKDNTIRIKFEEVTPEQLEEIKLIQSGYERLKKDNDKRRATNETSA
jgi:hypothetical protein